MSDVVLTSGQVVDYPYLWGWQAEAGREHGEKDRPVCLALAIREGDVTHLILLAISGTPPRADQRTIEIPPLELRRAGLSDFKAGWLTVGEFNYDVAERSFYYDGSRPPRGRFSRRFMGAVLEALRGTLQSGQGRIDRTR
jgi:hypothetical protein